VERPIGAVPQFGEVGGDLEFGQHVTTDAATGDDLTDCELGIDTPFIECTKRCSDGSRCSALQLPLLGSNQEPSDPESNCRAVNDRLKFPTGDRLKFPTP
jgi:hypothetical protein